MRTRAKIAATLGPASDRPGVLRKLLDAGVSVVRLNLSHGDADDHRRRVAAVRRAERSTGRPVAVLADLQGPRFRVGRLPGGSIDLDEGAAVTLIAGRATAPAGMIPVSYAALARETSAGDRVLLDDGKLVLRVISVRGEHVRCEVEQGGTLTDRKGINLPGGALSAPALTAKDRRDLALAVDMEADWLAVSFVRRPEDVRTARRLLRKHGSTMPIMAKIERPEAVERLDAILGEADGILVARGDLGVELPPETVPVLQKRIIATQMLESMRFEIRPTRAEASDVANAVFDGSGSLLLTAETAVGEYPLEAVEMMARIIAEAEGSGRVNRPPLPTGRLSVTDATCVAAGRAAHDVGAKFLAAFTVSGRTAAAVARFRPSTPILAFTPSYEVRRRLALHWGLETRSTPDLGTTRELMVHLDKDLRRARLAADGDLVVVLSGFPVGISGNTNLVTVHRVGSA